MLPPVPTPLSTEVVTCESVSWIIRGAFRVMLPPSAVTARVETLPLFICDLIARSSGSYSARPNLCRRAIGSNRTAVGNLDSFSRVQSNIAAIAGARVVVDMELPAPVVGDRPETEIVLGPVAVIVTLPALPAPTLCWPVRSTMPLLLRIPAPSFKNKEPTFARTAPALPSQPVDVSILVSAFIVNKGVVIEILPASPGVKSVTATKGLPAESLIALSLARTCIRSPGAGAIPSPLRSEA